MPMEPAVFKFWQAVEALTPQKADKPDPFNPREPVYLIDEHDLCFPWESPTHLGKRIRKDRFWRYTLQCGIYRGQALAALLEEEIGAHPEVYDDGRDGGRSRLFDVGLDESGYPTPESFVLSLACWSAGQILQFDDGIEALDARGRIDTTGQDEAREDPSLVDSGYRGFDELCGRLMRRLAVEAARLRESGKPPDRDWFDGLVRLIASKCFLPDAIIGRTPAYIAKCWQIDRRTDAKNGERRDDLLNSFFIGDLRLLDEAWRRNDVGRGLAEYMTAVVRAQPSARFDLREQDGIEAAYRSLAPDRLPQGQWPADHPLAFSQQLAVSKAWIPLDSMLEGRVEEKLRMERRSFEKPLRFDAVEDVVFPDFWLADAGQDFPMEVFGRSDPGYEARKHAMVQYYGQTYGASGWWHWDAAADPDRIPDLPPRH